MEHLTQKPVELAVRAIQYSSLLGQNVLDLFGGSGSTLIASEQIANASTSAVGLDLKRMRFEYVIESQKLKHVLLRKFFERLRVFCVDLGTSCSHLRFACVSGEWRNLNPRF